MESCLQSEPVTRVFTYSVVDRSCCRWLLFALIRSRFRVLLSTNVTNWPLVLAIKLLAYGACTKTAEQFHSCFLQSWMLVCWLSDWIFARLIAPVVTTTSITLSSNKIQNGELETFWNWLTPGPPGKWQVKRRV